MLYELLPELAVTEPMYSNGVYPMQLAWIIATCGGHSICAVCASAAFCIPGIKIAAAPGLDSRSISSPDNELHLLMPAFACC